MSAPSPAYSIERLAPGSYDVLLDGRLLAALTREINGSGTAREWLIDLLEEVPPTDLPVPFTAQQHAFSTLAAALSWLGIRNEAAGVEFTNGGEPVRRYGRRSFTDVKRAPRYLFSNGASRFLQDQRQAGRAVRCHRHDRAGQ